MQPPGEGGGMEMNMNKGGDSIAPYVSDSFSLLPQAVSGTDLPKHRVMLVGDSNTMPLYGAQVRTILSQVFAEVSVFTFKAGEEHKNLESIEQLLLELMERRFDRSDCIAALGGGVTGDMAGFAAAVYMRGIRYIQVPTTLLAAVDSSVGGKTAVDLPQGKNLAGAFHQPSLVICDTDCLKTLPADVYADGMAEVIKSAVIGSPELFGRLCGGAGADAEDVIASCVEIKRSVVESDEFEGGRRMLLNLGHSFGHAAEKCSGYTLSHGRAVAMGTVLISRAACAKGLLGTEDLARIEACVKANGLPAECPYSASQILEAMRSDKKFRGGRICLAVPRTIGRCELMWTEESELPGWLAAGGLR